MIGLLKNEIVKIRSKKSIYLMSFFVFIFIVITNILYKDFNESHKQVIINFFDEYSLMICLFILIISSFIVSDEFNKGTIKILLVSPYKRSKVLLAKLFACLIVIFISIIFILILQIIIGSIVLDINSLSFDCFKTFVLNFLGLLPMFLLILSISFFINTVFLSSLWSMVIPLMLYMFSDIILNFNINLVKFLPNYNWDFTKYVFNKIENFQYTNLLFSVIICVAYFSILIFISFIVFNRRDIKSV